MGLQTTDGGTRFDGAWADFCVGRKAWGYRADQLLTTHPVAGEVPDNRSGLLNFDGICYAKGASALRQLMASVGAHLNLDQVTLDIECPMEDSQNIDIVVWLDEVSYPVVSVKKYSDFAWVDELVPLPDLGMILE